MSKKQIAKKGDLERQLCEGFEIYSLNLNKFNLLAQLLQTLANCDLLYCPSRQRIDEYQLQHLNNPNGRVKTVTILT